MKIPPTACAIPADRLGNLVMSVEGKAGQVPEAIRGVGRLSKAFSSTPVTPSPLDGWLTVGDHAFVVARGRPIKALRYE